MNLKLARVKRRLSQGQLSKISGVSRGSISAIELTGTDNCKISTLKKLASALGVSLIEIID